MIKAELKQYRLLVSGGGTGGHLYPALAVIDALKQQKPCTILFAGTRHGLEGRVVPERGLDISHVWISGFHRNHLVRNLLFPLKVAVSFIQAMVMILTFHPDVILGTGGYVCWPVMTAGVLLGKKTAIQEQNWKPGVVNRLLAPHVGRVYLSFEASRPFFRRSDNLMVAGNPTRDNLEGPAKDEARRAFELQSNATVLFVFGGSQGARVVNQAILDSLDQLLSLDCVQILWATGPRWADEIRQSTASYGDQIRIAPYIDRMDLAYAACDLVCCRAGATTVAEITRLGIPAVLVPFAAAAANHQEKNARMLRDAGGAAMILEAELSDGMLAEKLLDLLNDASRRQQIGQYAKMLGKPLAAQNIAGDLIALIDTD